MKGSMGSLEQDFAAKFVTTDLIGRIIFETTFKLMVSIAHLARNSLFIRLFDLVFIKNLLSEMLGRPDNISAEEYKRIIEGNPKISYMTVSIHGNPVPLETSLKCWHCPFATTKYVSYISHQNCHGANSKYQCPACNYTAKTYRGMRNHELAHKIEHSVTSSQSAPATEPVALPSTLASTFSPPLQASSTAESGYGNGNVVVRALGLAFASFVIRLCLLLKFQADSFFLSSIKIMNIKPMNRNSPTIADAFQNGILKLKGDTDEGKSSFILAVMLGLGYDLFLESNEPSSPISICGLELNSKNVLVRM